MAQQSERNDQAPAPEDNELLKVTVYLSRENIVKLDELRLKRFRERKRRVDRSSLIREAIDHL